MQIYLRSFTSSGLINICIKLFSFSPALVPLSADKRQHSIISLFKSCDPAFQIIDCLSLLKLNCVKLGLSWFDLVCFWFFFLKPPRFHVSNREYYWSQSTAWLNQKTQNRKTSKQDVKILNLEEKQQHQPLIFRCQIFLHNGIFWLKAYKYKPRMTSLTLA